jgi:hypothetical protein
MEHVSNKLEFCNYKLYKLQCGSLKINIFSKPLKIESSVKIKSNAVTLKILYSGCLPQR